MRYRILHALMEGKGSRAQVVDFVTGAKLADGRGEKDNRKSIVTTLTREKTHHCPLWEAIDGGTREVV